jgi:cytochrome c556
MKNSRSFAVALLTTSCLFAGAVRADDPPSKGEQALKYRKSLYQVMAWNFGPMGAMAQGKVP